MWGMHVRMQVHISALSCVGWFHTIGIARSEVSDLKLQLQESASTYHELARRHQEAVARADELARRHHEAVARADAEASGKDSMLQQARKY